MANKRDYYWKASLNEKQLVVVGSELGVECEREVLLQMGRMSADSFSLDVAFPFSPLQAFAVALSAFHPKLAVDWILSDIVN